jgi:hypothetical protein
MPASGGYHDAAIREERARKVGGGILAVAPGTASIAVWAPGLDAAGNSHLGRIALERLTKRLGPQPRRPQRLVGPEPGRARAHPRHHAGERRLPRRGDPRGA